MSDIFPNPFAVTPQPSPQMVKAPMKTARPMAPIVAQAVSMAEKYGEFAADGCDTAVLLAKLVFETNASMKAAGRPMRPSEMRAITRSWAATAGKLNSKKHSYSTVVSKIGLNAAMGVFVKLSSMYPNCWSDIELANTWLRQNGKHTRLPVSHLNRLIELAKWIMARINFTQLDLAELPTIYAPKTRAQKADDQIMHTLRRHIASNTMKEVQSTLAQNTCQDILDVIDVNFP